MSNLIAMLEALGPIRAYRTPPVAAAAALQIGERQQEARLEFDRQPTPRSRALYALKVTAELVALLRKRASACELAHADLACENVDVHHVLAEWVEFVTTELEREERAG